MDAHLFANREIEREKEVHDHRVTVSMTDAEKGPLSALPAAAI
jgi:hypothetical protein